MFPAIRRWMVVRSPRVEKDLLKVACCCWFGYSAWLRKFDGFCRISSGGWIFQALFVEYCNNIIIILGVINVKKFNFLFNCWEWNLFLDHDCIRKKWGWWKKFPFQYCDIVISIREQFSPDIFVYYKTWNVYLEKISQILR